MRGLKKVRAIERAINAEVELQEYHALTLAQTEMIRALKVEITLLRKVAEAARGVFLGEGEHLCSEFEDAMDRLEQALAELDKE